MPIDELLRVDRYLKSLDDQLSSLTQLLDDLPNSVDDHLENYVYEDDISYLLSKYDDISRMATRVIEIRGKFTDYVERTYQLSMK